MHASPLPFLRTRSRLVLQAILFAVAVVLACGLMPAGTAVAAPVSVAQCNSILNTPGQAIECSVTVVNTLDATTGVGSSIVTVQACTGAAGAPLCAAPVTSSFADVVTSVSQCNSSVDGGGAAATCTVNITNDVTGGATPTTATVNQCIRSADGSGTAICSPVQATTGATVNQCNDSGNGGGTTVRCTVVAGSTTSASLPVSVNQCNFSANGGGSLVTCRTTITNNVIAAVVQPAPSASATPTATVSVAPAPPTASPSTSPSTAPSAAPSATPSVSPSAVASASPATSVAPTTAAPVPTAVTAVPVLPDETGFLPEVLTPVAAPPAAAPPVDDAPVAVGVPLPTTGVDTSLLSLLGLLTLTTGGVLLLLTRRPRGRHVLR